MTYQDLEKLVKKYNPEADFKKLEAAFNFAEKAHQDQKRLSGEPYFNHSLATAMTLAELKMDEPTIIAGLLHDVPEDTSFTLEEIKKEFGEEVARLVEGITKLGRLKYRGVTRYLENLRKMFLAMAEDIRVIFIKFADRLHNLKTLSALPEEKRKRIALETIEIYAPIANRLGMGEIKGQLEDLAFEHLYPDEYQWLIKNVSHRTQEFEKYLDKVKKIVSGELEKEKIKIISIGGRTKHLYSLYQKLKQYEMDITKIYDLVALRIVVPSVPDCYTILGLLHKKWKPLKGRIKDYIAQPKPNGYQSLQTTVFCSDGRIVEFQIRTKEMHDHAEFGLAAHWYYHETDREKIKSSASGLAWLKELARLQKEIKDDKKYLETLKIDIFQNRIFVFTPKGDAIDLPEDSTPVDFAYAIHTDLGDKCSGAKINDKMESLDTKLKSGDLCEIIIDKNRKGPNHDWLDFVKTSLAKNHIKASSKK